MVSHCGFMYISQITKDLEKLIMFLEVCLASLVKCVLKFFV